MITTRSCCIILFFILCHFTIVKSYSSLPSDDHICCSTPVGDSQCCMNGASCNTTSKICQCTTEFSGYARCDYVACKENSIGMLSDYSCGCKPNWSGTYCWNCENDQACEDVFRPRVQKNGTFVCDKNVYSINQLHAKNYQCNLNDEEIEQLTGPIYMVFQCKTISANQTIGQCEMQVWNNKGWPPSYRPGIQYEVFYCNFDNCEQIYDVSKNQTKFSCKNTLCGYPGHFPIPDVVYYMLLDMKGAGVFTCTAPESNSTFCVLEHEDMPFLLHTKCTQSECLFIPRNETPPVPPPPPIPQPESNIALIEGIAIISSISGLLLILLVIILVIHVFYSCVFCRRRLEQWNTIHKNKSGYSFTFESIKYRISKKQTILYNVSGHFANGSITAIIGSSGGGKSTLLDILAGISKSGTLSGSIWLNEEPISNQYSLLKSYVSQDALIMETMTVMEALLFASELKLPEKMPQAEKKRKVAQVLEWLDLTHLKHRRIGGLMQRGISGGEKRRVSIAMELLADTPIVFLDEPTSNIDSYTSTIIMRVLHKLAKEQNKTVIISIHQPSLTIFDLFDTVLLLDQGRCCYMGPAKQIQQHLEELKYPPCPEGENVADYLMELLATRYNNIDQEAYTLYPYRNEQKPETRQFVSLILSNGEEVVLDNQKREVGLIQNIKSDVNRFSRMPSYFYTSFYKQFQVLALRTLFNFVRNPLLMPLQVLLHIVMGIILGFIYYQMPLDFFGTQNRLGGFFFCAVLFGLGAMTSLELFISERDLFKRERLQNLYRASAYFCAKVLFDVIPMRIIPPIFLCTIAYYMMGLRTDEFYHFVIYISICITFNVVCGALCLFIGVISSNASIANCIALCVHFYAMLFGGFLINTSNLPNWIAFVKYTSPYQYFLEALMSNEFTARLVLFNPRGFPSVIMTGERILLQFGFQMNDFPIDIGILLAMGVLLLVGSGLLLQCSKEKR